MTSQCSPAPINSCVLPNITVNCVITDGLLTHHRYHLDPDVRRSLYSLCEEWVRAVGKHRRYMGGTQPNLADLVSKMRYS